jgi:hypothetical protein
MDLVLKCGVDYGSNEHDIATQLFVKRDQREMFLTLPTNEIRFQWLTRDTRISTEIEYDWTICILCICWTISDCICLNKLWLYPCYCLYNFRLYPWYCFSIFSMYPWYCFSNFSMYPYVYICRCMRVIVTIQRMVVMSFGVLFWVVLKWHKKYVELYIDKNPPRIANTSDMGWLLETLKTSGECHRQLRMSTGCKVWASTIYAY